LNFNGITDFVKRKYFDWLGEQLQIRELAEWNSVDRRAIVRQKGSYFIQTLYGSSVQRALEAG
jgi:hypothetical protein